MKKLMICVLMITGIVFCSSCQKKPDDWWIRIGNCNVYEEEYRMVAESEKADIYNYFYASYEVPAEKLDWTTSYGGESPYEKLMEETEKKLMENTVILEKACAYGIVEEQQFEDFKALWKEEMEQRKSMQEKGEVVYGPVNMELREYYDYYMSDILADVKKAVMEEEKVSQKELRDYYDSVKTERFVKRPTVSGMRIYVNASEDLSSLIDLRNAILAYGKETDVQWVQEQCRKYGIHWENVEMNETTLHHDNSVYPALRENAFSITGNVTEITENGATKDFMWISSRGKQGIYSFEEVKPAVISEYTDHIFLKHMEQWKKETKLTRNKDLSEKVKEMLGES